MDARWEVAVENDDHGPCYTVTFNTDQAWAAKIIRDKADEVTAKVREQIDKERKSNRGMWIEVDDGWDGSYWECSVCGEPWTLIVGTPLSNSMDYCPRCGAKMDGERPVRG